VRAQLGKPSILINNAGLGNASPILELSPERLHLIFEVNLISHWFTIQQFLPDMIEMGRGHIMGVSSAVRFPAYP
jgi:all-trans-retinol dehydrogenase (NAD+)